MTGDRLIIRCLYVVAMILLLCACSQKSGTEAGQGGRSKEQHMKASYQERTPAPIPPIDAAAPKTFETASFGLG